MRILLCFFISLSIAYAASSQYAVELNHDNSGLSFEDKPELHLHEFTLECWIMIKDTGLSVISGEDGIPLIPLISRGFEDSTHQSGLNFVLGLRREDFTMVAGFEDIQNHINHKLTGFSALLFDQWYHLAATYDGSSLRLYLNGKPESMEEIDESPFSDTPGITAIGKMFDENGHSHGSFSGSGRCDPHLELCPVARRNPANCQLRTKPVASGLARKPEPERRPGNNASHRCRVLFRNN